MNFRSIYEKKAKQYDDWFDSYKSNAYVCDSSSIYNGKMVLFNMLPDTAPELGLIGTLTVLYCCKDCKNYKNHKLLDILERAIISMRSKFNEDGTNTMYQSNFHTAEQFGIAYIAWYLLIFKKNITDDREKEIFDLYCILAAHMVKGCMNGGFHTPNHRWVESQGLLLAYKALIDTKYSEYAESAMEKAKRYLAEGVDCDEYGEWSERSAGMYNIHCDNAFLHIYSVIGNEEYYDCVYRNLMLMRYYINPEDNSLFTQNSRRNDKGELGSVQLFNKGRKFYAEAYVHAYLIASYLKKDQYLASMAYMLIEKAEESGRGLYVSLDDFLMYPELIDWEFEYNRKPLPTVYENYLPNSYIVRKKTDVATYTFLARNPVFMFIDALGLNVRMRMCSSFFAIAQFVPKTMEKTEKGYKLEMTAIADYKLPLENPDGITTKDYWSIDYSKRGSIQKQELTLTAETEFTDDGFNLKISAKGTEKVPSKLEIFVNEGLHLETGDSILVTSAGGNFLSKDADVRLESEAGTVMDIKGMFCKHLYIDMRGSLDPIPGMFELVSTGYSPFENEISFKIKQRENMRTLY